MFDLFSATDDLLMTRIKLNISFQQSLYPQSLDSSIETYFIDDTIMI